MIISCEKKKSVIIELNEDEAREFVERTNVCLDEGEVLPMITIVMSNLIREELEKT